MGLIAYYPFKNGSLENLVGVGGNANNNGALFNNTLGKDSYYFNNGSTTYINHLGINIPQVCSFSAWNYQTNTSGQMLFYVYDGGGFVGVYFSGINIYWNTGDGSNNPFRKNGVNVTAPTLNEWHHYVITCSTTEIMLYIDGIYVGSTITYRNPARANIVIGNYQTLSGYPNSGYIANFRIYNHTLSPNEVTNLYKNHSSENNVSLIAHYPLNGDTDDYSSNGFNATNSGAIIDNNGKIGKCYSFDGAQMTTTIPFSSYDPALTNSTMSCWLYIKNLTNFIPTIPFTTTGKKATENIIGYSSYGGLAISLEYTEAGLLSLYFSYRSSISSTGVVYNNVLTEKWYHLAGVIENDIIKFYINGILIGTSNISTIKNVWTDTRNFSISLPRVWGGNGPAINFPTKINDVRLYNTVISEKEIKELAKAKILHYNFNDFQEPTQNYDILTNSNYVGQSNSYGSYCTITNGNYYGKDCYKIVLNIPSGTVFSSIKSAYYNMTSTNLVTKGFVNGDWVTRSFDVYIECHNDINYTRPHLSIEGNSTSKSYNQIDKTKLGTWQRVSCTSQIVDITQQNNYLFYVARHIAGTTTTDLSFVIYVCNVQLEKKSYATPYVPTSRTGQVQDSSGYRNHADILATKTPQWTELSKIGTGCYYWGTDKIRSITQSINVPTDTITMNCWFKVKTPTTAGFTSYHMPMAINSSYHEMGISSSGALRVGFYLSGTRYVNNHGSGLLDGNWHMLTTVYDGTSKKGYIDGVLVGNIATGGTLTSGTQTLRIGEYTNNDYGNKDAYQDDVRIYATALSQEDITELYEVGQQIHNTGILETNEVIENGYYHNLIQYNKWVEGTFSYTNNWLSYSTQSPQYTSNLIYSVNPFGQNDIIYENKAVDNFTFVSNRSFGIRANPLESLDNTKKYRVSSWVYIDPSTTGTYLYQGYVGSICNFNTTNSNTNPYYSILTHTAVNKGIWLLVVAFIYPYGSTSNVNEGARYRIDGTIHSTTTAFNWNSITSFYLRYMFNYQYGNVTANQYTLMYRPRLDLCDGTEPTIEDLLKGYDHKPFPLIQPEFSEQHYTYTNKYKEAFTTGITFIRDDSEVSQQLYCDYFEGEVYAKTLSGTFVVKGTIFTTIAQKIDINQFYDRVVANIDNNIIYVNKLIEN
ncbi:MAG: LamG domain-containing protein [Candidatus Muirbacterium halophilum]|nr:LamG domain-containing protein [Candidatus Muirbacterium halophilum]